MEPNPFNQVVTEMNEDGSASKKLKQLAAMSQKLIDVCREDEQKWEDTDTVTSILPLDDVNTLLATGNPPD